MPSNVAPAHLQHLSTRIDPQELAEKNATPSIYIWNVSPRSFTEHISPFGNFTIPACEKGQPVSEPLVVKGWYHQTATDSVEGVQVQYKHLWTSGKSIAVDIIGNGPNKHPSQRLAKFGIGISAGSYPTASELAEWHAAWETTCAALVQEADQKFAVNGGFETDDYGKPRMAITKDHVDACEVLRLDRPWAKTPGKMAVCDQCGTGNMPTAAWCKECDVLLNADIAKERTPAKYVAYLKAIEELTSPTEEKRGPGRPPKVA